MWPPALQQKEEMLLTKIPLLHCDISNAGSSVHFYKLLLLCLRLSVVNGFQKLGWFSLFIDSNHIYSLEGCVRRSHIHVDISIFVYYMVDIGCISFDLVDITYLSLTGWYNFPPSFHALLRSKTSQEEWQGTHVFSAVCLMDSETFLMPSGLWRAPQCYCLYSNASGVLQDTRSMSGSSCCLRFYRPL